MPHSTVAGRSRWQAWCDSMRFHSSISQVWLAAAQELHAGIGSVVKTEMGVCVCVSVCVSVCGCVWVCVCYTGSLFLSHLIPFPLSPLSCAYCSNQITICLWQHYTLGASPICEFIYLMFVDLCFCFSITDVMTALDIHLVDSQWTTRVLNRGYC